MADTRREVREGHGLPNDVSEAMADIALVFHWSPDVMTSMPLGELMGWRTKAAMRHNPEK
jgi:hypothetical protein